jgi:hypothetical protein
MAYKQSIMQPIIVHLHKSKALASTCSMSIRFYEVGWDVEHLLNVISEILGALVVILLHGPTSICMSFLQRSRPGQRYPRCSYLARTTNKAREQSITKPRKITKRSNKAREDRINTKGTPKEKGLSPSRGFLIPEPKETGVVVHYAKV